MNHSLPWRPRFLFNTGGDVEDWGARLPMRPWNHRVATVGGSRTAAGGVPAAYVVRRDRNLVITLRVWETELPTLFRLIEWGQASETILFYPDRSDDSTSFLVYLEAPLAGDDVMPTRSADYPKVFEMTLELRPVISANWTLNYFPTC